MRNMDMKKFIIFLLLLSSSTLFAQKNKASKDTTTTFEVSGSCEMCKMRIEEAAKGNGVKSAVWNVDSKMLTLVYDPSVTTSYKVHDRIADVGHDTRLIKAATATYNGLADCCRYRDNAQTEEEDGNADMEVNGVVVEQDEKGNLKPLQGASIIIAGTSGGISTNENGFFTKSPLSRFVVLISGVIMNFVTAIIGIFIFL